jgi:Sulfotransferase family
MIDLLAPFDSRKLPWNTYSRHSILLGTALLAAILFLVSLSAHRHFNSNDKYTAAAAAASRGYSITTASSCTPRDPQVIVYNRIPKAGSTTLISLLSHLAEKNNFTLVLPTPYYNHAAARDAVLTALKTGKRTVVCNHFNFPEILYGSSNGNGNNNLVNNKIKKNNQQVAYINVMRNPVDRCASFYYYTRYGDRSKQLKTNTIEQYGNSTLDECVNQPWKEIAKCFNCKEDTQALAFCGREGGGCSSASAEEILEQAWENVQAHYFVGITEDLHGTAEMFELLFPSFFRGITEAMEVTAPKKVSSSREQYIAPSEKARKVVEKWAAVDMKLYTRVHARYLEQRKACFA